MQPKPSPARGPGATAIPPDLLQSARAAAARLETVLAHPQPDSHAAAEALAALKDSFDALENAAALPAPGGHTQFFVAFMENLPGPAWIKDHEGRYVFGNRSVLSRMRLTAGEVLGKRDQDLQPAESAAQFRRNDAEVLATLKAMQTVETAYRGGECCHLLVSKFPIPTGPGRPPLVGGIGFDITDLKRTEDALLKSEERFRRLAENARDVIFRMSLPDARYEYISPALFDICGYTPVEFYARPDLLREVVHPAWRETFDRELCAFREGRVAPSYEYQVLHRSGEVRWVNQRNVAIRDQSGRLVAIEGIVTDITARRQLEAQLQSSEERFRSIFENASDGILLADPETRQFRLANDTICRMLGWSKEEFGALTVTDIHPESEAAFVTTDFDRKARGESSVARYVPMKRKDGTVFFADISTAAISIGGQTFLAGFFRDVTERKFAESALRESEERYRQLAECSTDMISRHAPDSEVVFVSPACRTLLGYTEDELLGKPGDFFVHPEDRKRLWEVICDQTGKTDHYTSQHRMRRKAGDYVWVETNGRLVEHPESGNLTEIVCITRDITERKRLEESLRESEERYRRLVEHSPNLIGVAIDRKVAFINAAGARMLGAAAPEELIGRPVDLFVHPHDRDRARANIRQILQHGLPTRAAQETWVRLDGTPLEVELNAVPFQHQELPAIFIVAVDITERKRAGEQLEAYARQLQNLSRQLVEAQESERRAIARELHDEIGQALTAIQIELQFALRGPGANPVRTQLAETLRLVDGVLQQTQDLSLRLRPSMLDDLGLVAAVRWYVNHQASRAGLRADVVADPLPGRLDAVIETACFRVAQEAVTNIVRHAGAAHVTLELRQLGDHLHLTVRDDGVGFNVADARAGAARGGSLGLLGMEERVSLVGGRVEFRSAPREGTTVHALFPLKFRDETG